MQFMEVCKEKPDSLPPLESIGLEPRDPALHKMTRGGRGRHHQGSEASISAQQTSLGNFAPNSAGFDGEGAFGQFTTAGAAKLSSEDRFSLSFGQRSIPTSSGFGGRPPPMVRTVDQGAGHTNFAPNARGFDGRGAWNQASAKRFPEYSTFGIAGR